VAVAFLGRGIGLLNWGYQKALEMVPQEGGKVSARNREVCFKKNLFGIKTETGSTIEI